jgi:hypothetical protein
MLGGYDDVLVVKFNTNGVPQWATYYGGSYMETGDDIALDASGNVCITGYSRSTDFPVINAYQPSCGGNSDIIVLKLNKNGTPLWVTYYGGSALDNGLRVATDASGNICVTGNTLSTDFPVVNPGQSTLAGGRDAIILHLNEAGRPCAWTGPKPAITVSPNPAVDPGGELNTIYLGYGAQSVTLTASGGTSYSWYPSTYLSCTNCPAPVMTPTAEGTYTYTVTAADQSGCTYLADVTINVIDVFGGTNKATVCINGRTISVNYHAVPALIANAGATLGPCTPKASEETEQIPTAFSLSQNYPNPFNPSTTIEYGIPEEGVVRLVVYDIYGREVSALVDELKQTGSYMAQFDGTDLPSGIYMYQLEWNGAVKARTMTLMK